MPDSRRHEENRLSWNAATEAHNSHKGDQTAHYRAGGHMQLKAEERELLGDIRGMHVVHLQCNSGQDTLSLAQLGAEVTGVDISDTAIDFARGLSRDSGVPATFVRANIYDWLAETASGADRFDIAFSSYGAIPWLSDLRRWAQGIAGILRLDGRLVLIEYHPVMQMFDEQMVRRYPYSSAGEAMTWEEGVGDYIAETGITATGYEEGVVDFRNPFPVHEWAWGIGDVATSLLEAGLRIEALKEYPWANGWKPFDWMRELPGLRWTLPEDQPPMPLMYGLVARNA